MKYIIDAHEFSFNKIKNGTRKIAVHLFDKQTQKVKINDVLEIRNTSNKESLECIVKGLAIFDNFSDLTDSLTPQSLGYTSKEEVLIRINRMYSKELQQNLNAVAFFLEPRYEKVNIIERGEYER